MESLRGQLLIASPALLDPNFRRAVVLVAEHGEEGAMGIVLNRLSEATVEEAAPPLATLTDAEDMVRVGGPVQPEAVVVLAEFADPHAAATLVFGRVGFVPGDADLAVVSAAIVRARVFAGYAGWSAGQLEAELREESWIVEPARPEDVFGGGDVWSEALRRKGGPYRLVALMPDDPSLN